MTVDSIVSKLKVRPPISTVQWWPISTSEPPPSDSAAARSVMIMSCAPLSSSGMAVSVRAIRWKIAIPKITAAPSDQKIAATANPTIETRASRSSELEAHI